MYPYVQACMHASIYTYYKYKQASVAQSDAHLTGDQEVAGLIRA